MKTNRTRRQIFHIDTVCINYLSYTNPLVIACWSFFFPGFGQILMGQYIHGWVLFTWEVGIIVYSNINMAIIYSFTGNFEEATRVLGQDGQWGVLLYSALFVYGLWGSYTVAVETNHLTYLAHAENAPISLFSINSFQYNYLTKRNPWMAVLWSILMPGLGALYNRRILSAVFSLAWWVIIVFKSNFLPGIYYTAMGNFKQATMVLDPEWFLFLPSIYVFTMYNAYLETVETNKAFEKEQANFLRNNYQADVDFPIQRTEDDPLTMRIIATFEHSTYVEMALVGLKQIGISKNSIYATSLDKRNADVAFIDTIHRSDGKGFLDIPALLGALFMAFGAIYGFILEWGRYFGG